MAKAAVRPGLVEKAKALGLKVTTKTTITQLNEMIAAKVSESVAETVTNTNPVGPMPEFRNRAQRRADARNSRKRNDGRRRNEKW